MKYFSYVVTFLLLSLTSICTANDNGLACKSIDTTVPAIGDVGKVGDKLDSSYGCASTVSYVSGTERFETMDHEDFHEMLQACKCAAELVDLEGNESLIPSGVLATDIFDLIIDRNKTMKQRSIKASNKLLLADSYSEFVDVSNACFEGESEVKKIEGCYEVISKEDEALTMDFEGMSEKSRLATSPNYKKNARIELFDHLHALAYKLKNVSIVTKNGMISDNSESKLKSIIDAEVDFSLDKREKDKKPVFWTNHEKVKKSMLLSILSNKAIRDKIVKSFSPGQYDISGREKVDKAADDELSKSSFIESIMMNALPVVNNGCVNAKKYIKKQCNEKVAKKYKSDNIYFNAVSCEIAKQEIDYRYKHCDRDGKNTSSNCKSLHKYLNAYKDKYDYKDFEVFSNNIWSSIDALKSLDNNDLAPSSHKEWAVHAMDVLNEENINNSKDGSASGQNSAHRHGNRGNRGKGTGTGTGTGTVTTTGSSSSLTDESWVKQPSGSGFGERRPLNSSGGQTSDSSTSQVSNPSSSFYTPVVANSSAPGNPNAFYAPGPISEDVSSKDDEVDDNDIDSSISREIANTSDDKYYDELRRREKELNNKETSMLRDELSRVKSTISGLKKDVEDAKRKSDSSQSAEIKDSSNTVKRSVGDGTTDNNLSSVPSFVSGGSENKSSNSRRGVASGKESAGGASNSSFSTSGPNSRGSGSASTSTSLGGNGDSGQLRLNLNIPSDVEIFSAEEFNSPDFNPSAKVFYVRANGKVERWELNPNAKGKKDRYIRVQILDDIKSKKKKTQAKAKLSKTKKVKTRTSTSDGRDIATHKKLLKLLNQTKD